MLFNKIPNYDWNAKPLDKKSKKVIITIPNNNLWYRLLSKIRLFRLKLLLKSNQASPTTERFEKDGILYVKIIIPYCDYGYDFCTAPEITEGKSIPLLDYKCVFK